MGQRVDPHVLLEEHLTGRERSFETVVVDESLALIFVGVEGPLRNPDPFALRPQAHQGRGLFFAAASTSLPIATSSATWKSNMPTHAKSAPFWNAY